MAQNFTSFTPLESAQSPSFSSFTPLDQMALGAEEEKQKKRPVDVPPDIPSVGTMGNVSDFFPEANAQIPQEKPETESGLSFGEEFVKGAKGAVQYALPSMARQIGLQGSAVAMMDNQKRLDLMDKIDSGVFPTLKELKNDPVYEAMRDEGKNLNLVTGYFANRNVPDVAAKMRGATTKEFQAMAMDTRTHIDMLNQYAKENKEKYGPRVEKFTDINWTDPRVVADFTNWLGYNMGAGAVQMAPVMLAAVVAKQPGLLATSGAMGVSEAVGNRMKFIQDKIKGLPPEQQGEAIAKYVADTGDANLITGLVSGSFDLILGPAAKAAKVGLSKAIGDVGLKAAFKTAAKELPKDIGGEAVTGALQEITQIAAKKNLGEEGKRITLENLKDIANAAAAEAAGAPVGTAINLGVGAVRNMRAQTQPPSRVEPSLQPDAPGNQPVLPEPNGRVEPSLQPNAGQRLDKLLDAGGARSKIAPSLEKTTPVREDVPGMVNESDLDIQEKVTPVTLRENPNGVPVTPVTVKPPEQFAAPAGFAYTLTESPAYEGLAPLSIEDADFELEALEDSAIKGRMTPERFAQSEIGRRLNSGQITDILKAIRNDPVAAIQVLRKTLQPSTAITSAPKVTPVAATPPSAPVTSLYDRIGNPTGPAQENAANKILPADEADLLKRMIVKTVDNGLAAGKTRQQIVDQLVALTKDGIKPSDFSRINDYMTERGVVEGENPNAVPEAPAAPPASPAIVPPPTKAAESIPETPTVPPAKTPKLFEPPAEQVVLDGLPTVEVPLKDIQMSKDLPQFKTGANAKGVVEPLAGKFERTGVAPVQLWQRLDGRLEIISGRHRLDLAGRSKEATIPAQIHYESQGFDLDKATTLDSELNIRDGQGKVKDYVDYFKGSKITREEAVGKGLLARALGKRAYGIATQGEEALITAVRNDEIGDEAAFYIALNAPNNARLQAVGLRSIMDGKSMQTALNIMEAVKTMAGKGDTNRVLFDDDQSLIEEATAMAKIASKMQQSIRDRLSAITGAAKNPDMAKAEGIDVRDPEAVKVRINELKAQKAVLENWSTNPELVAQIRAASGVEAPTFDLKRETPESRNEEGDQGVSQQDNAQGQGSQAQENFELSQDSPEKLEQREENARALAEQEAAKNRAAGAIAGGQKRKLNKAEEKARADAIRKERADAAVDDFAENFGGEAPAFNVTPEEVVGQKNIFASEAGPSAEYQAASEIANRASAEFRKVQEAYRKQEIGDDDFLAGRKVYDAAMSEFDAAVAKEQGQAESKDAIKDEKEFVEEATKDKLEAIAQDFMVGDMVRFGSIPGTVVGLEGDYVRMRPDTAKTAKAYQRVPKSSLTFVGRPDTTSMVSFSKEQNNKFGEEAGQLNANMGNLIQLLGANMYSSSLAEVTIKELLQNAFDAVKGAVADTNSKGEPIKSLYKTGKIQITIDSANRTISITDNARGMTPQIVREAFFTVAGSDKSDLPPGQRSGGLGLAKMGFMLGAENLKLDTVRDGVRVTVDTSSVNIANNNFTIQKSPAPKGEHGTTVTVKIPEYYIDPKNGDQRTIYFPSSVASIEALNKPLIGPVEVSIKRDYDNNVVLPIGVNFVEKDYTKFKANFDWGSADIFFGIQRVQDKYNIKHQVLSAGVYQFNPSFKLNDEKIPYNIVVNISPNVDARHPDYPFVNSRENFKERIKQDVEALQQYLGQISLGLEARDLQDSFKGVVSMPRMEAGQDIADISDKLKKTFGVQKPDKPTVVKALPKEVTVTSDAVTDTATKKILVDVKTKREEKEKGASFKGSEVQKAADFMLDMKQDPRLPAFHNNTNVDYLEVGRPYGEPEKFFAELGTLVVEMKEELAKSGFYGYEKLSPESLFFAGVSVDKKYGGVHIKVPYKAIFVNPFYSFGARTIFGIREQLLNTMIHEIAHTGSMDHGVAHNNQMIKVEQYLADEGLLDYYRDAILDLLRRHESTFTAMKEAYDKSSTQNTAKSLEDYEKNSSSASSRGDDGGDRDKPSTVSSGTGQGRGEGVSGAKADATESQDSSGAGEAGIVADDKDLIEKHNRPPTPQLDPSPTKTTLVNASKASKEYLKLAFDAPLDALGTAANSIDRGVMYARNKNIWFGSGLNAADFAKYKGQLMTSQGLATASVALDNAIRGGQIATEVIFQGGIKFDSNSLNFVAAKKSKGMRGVYEAENELKKKLGNQLGTDIIQGYLEAKRSRSIQNEFYDRQAKLETLKEEYAQILESGASEKDIKVARDALADAKKEFNDIEIVFNKINMSDTEIDEFIARDKVHPELRKIMSNWSAINQNMLTLWRQVGLLSEKRYESLSNIEDYVPWQRIMNDETDIHSPVQATNRTMTNIGLERVFKKGTPTVITDFKATEGQQVFKIQPAKVMTVEVNGKTVDPADIKRTPEGEVRLNVPIAKGDLVVFTASREIENIIDNMTRNVTRMTMNGLRQYAAQRIVAEYATRNAKNQVMTFPKVDLSRGRFSFITNGRRIVVEIQDPLIAESVIGMETLGIAMYKPLAIAANITRRAITLSGAFQIKQIFKDAPTAALVTGVKRPLLLMGGVYKGFVTSLLNTDPTVAILKAAGIGGFQSSARTPEAEIKRRLGIMNRNVFDFMIKGMDHIGDASDMAQRVAVYKRVLAETGNETQALYQAANVINFLHHGSGQVAQFVVKTVPFAGAYANSIDVLAQGLAGGGLKGNSRAKNLQRLAVTGTLLTTMTLLYCMMVGDDDEYNQMDDQTKLRNFMIPGTKIMLPMNTSAAYFFKAIPEMLYNKVIKEGTDNAVDARRLRTALKEAAIDMLLGPTPVPSAVKPLLEIKLNKDFFTGRPVVPDSVAKLDASERYTAETSELGKRLSALTGTDEKRLLDPMEADHIVRGIFGSSGAMAQWFSNSIGAAAGERVAPTDKQQPFIGPFLRGEVPRRNEDLFYDFKELVDNKYGTYQKMIEREDFDAADKYLDKYGDLVTSHDYTSELSSDLKEINQMIRYYGESKETGMTPKERRDEITDLQRLKQEVLDSVIDFRKEAGL